MTTMRAFWIVVVPEVLLLQYWILTVWAPADKAAILCVMKVW